MKKIYLLVLIIFLVNTLMSQTKTELLKNPTFNQINLFKKSQPKFKSIIAPQKSPISRTNQTSVTKQRLDSLITTTSTNSPMQKTFFSYDSIGNMLLQSEYKFDNSLSVWTPSNKISYAYKGSKRTSESHFKWNATNNQWIFFYVDEYNYDINGNKSEDIYSEFSTISNATEKKSKTLYNYNSIDKLKSSSVYSWVNKDWTITDKTDFFYNKKGNDSIQKTFSWGDHWELNVVDTIKNIYNNAGIKTHYIDYINLIFSDTTKSTPFYKNDFELDSLGNEIVQEISIWDSIANNYIYNYKMEAIYNYNYKVNEMLAGDMWMNNFVNNMLLSIKSFSYNGSNWSLINYANYYYSTVQIQTATHSPMTDKVNIYPNPVTSSFQIKGIEGTSTVTLSDLNGKNLLTKQVTGNENISIANLPKGMYIAKVITNEGTIERKIVKE